MTPQRITAPEAARAFAACAGLDPQGQATPESVAHAGQCFTLAAPRGLLSYCVSFTAGVCWVHGAAGEGAGLTECGLAVIESQARAQGCGVVGFQTMRRGLVRRAKRCGYAVTREIGQGFILEKGIS